MPISESMVQDIVQEVMAKMQIADAPTGKHGIFKDMNDAIEAAKKNAAQNGLTNCEFIADDVLKKTVEDKDYEVVEIK